MSQRSPTRPGSLLRGAHQRLPAGARRIFRLSSSARSPIRFVKGFRRVLHVVPDELSEGATVPRQT